MSEGESRAAIAHHYDVSNEFYALFLDPEMVYTCAWYRDSTVDLAQAQTDKLELVCRKPTPRGHDEAPTAGGLGDGWANGEGHRGSK